MNNSLKLGLAVIMTGITGVGGLGVAKAQGLINQIGEKQGWHRGMWRERIAKHLGLTDAQKAQIKPIAEAARAEAKSVLANEKLTGEEKRTQIRAIKNATIEKVWPLLDASQKQKVEQARAKLRARLEQRLKDLDSAPKAP